MVEVRQQQGKADRGFKLAAYQLRGSGQFSNPPMDDEEFENTLVGGWTSVRWYRSSVAEIPSETSGGCLRA